DSITKPETFIENWFINECHRMMMGVKQLADNQGDIRMLQKRNRANETKPVTERSYTGEDAFDVIAEKVSGTLVFLPRLKELTSINDKADHYITEIIKFNKELYPKLLVEI